jgi:putative ABC transport system permease protein
MKPSNVLRLYRVRLRARWAQECLAIIGIAAGVALLFASQVSSTSLQGSVDQLTHGIEGDAKLQLLSRDPHGFAQATLAQVRSVSGVRAAAPILEAGASAHGPRGGASVELIGADESLASLHGSLVSNRSLAPFGGIGAVVLPAPLANTLGVVRFGQEVTLQLAGQTVQAPLYQVLGRRQIGALTASPVVLAPLSYAQEVTGLRGRVTRILVQPAPGAGARVRAALARIAAGHINVESSDYDEQMFTRAAAVSNQSTALFSAISALVGFLFAFNAMLLTVPARRRLIADLRRDGYTPATVLVVMLLDAIGLGTIGCVLGLALGQELSIHFLRSEPAFLSLAFAVGSERVVTTQTIVISVGGGMGAAIVAVLSPLRDVFSRDPLAAITPREGSSAAREGGRRALAGGVLIAAATALLLASPDASIPAMVLLTGALLLELPIVLSLTLATVKRLAGLIVSPIGHVATMELRAARARAVAIAATGAVAVFGSVAIQGSHGDLLAGLEGTARDSNAFTDLWVSPAGSYDLLNTAPFTPRKQAQLAALPGVRALRLYRSALLDYGGRRLLVIAPPRQATPLLARDQVQSGDATLAEARIRTGGWLMLSQAVAEEHHLRVGQTLKLPTPSPITLRVAAISTNLGWAPGAIVVSSADYAHAWQSTDASAYNLLLAPGFPPARAIREVRGALGTSSGLTVQSAAQRTAAQNALSRQSLSRLTQIATLIPIVAVLAMAAAMGAMVWQRRPRLAKLKLEGLARAELWRTILLESLLLLAVGCVSGALFGLYGQQLADRALARVINFPVEHSISAVPALASVSLVSAAALAILAVPGYLASSVPAALALQD